MRGSRTEKGSGETARSQPSSTCRSSRLRSCLQGCQQGGELAAWERSAQSRLGCTDTPRSQPRHPSQGSAISETNGAFQLTQGCHGHLPHAASTRLSAAEISASPSDL